MKKKAWRIVGEVGKWSLLVLLGLFAFARIYNFIDYRKGSYHPLFGVKQTVIVTASMSFVTEKNAEDLKDCHDQIQINDVIVTTNKIKYDSLKVHDIVLFRSAKGDICHRIIDKYETSEGKQMLVTRGDANEISDGAIEFTAVIGKVTNILPKMGYVVNFMNSAYFLLGVSLSLGFVTIGYIIVSSKKQPKDVKKSSKNENAVSENGTKQNNKN